MKPVLIHFDANEFNKQSEGYKNYIKMQATAKRILKELAPDITLDPKAEILEPLKLYFDHLEANPANLLQMTGEAIAKAQKKDLTPLYKVNEELKNAITKAPAIKDYSVYAETPEEIQRFESIVKLIKDFKELTSIDKNLKLGMLRLALQNRVTTDWQNETLVPNWYYVKQTNFAV